MQYPYSIGNNADGICDNCKKFTRSYYCQFGSNISFLIGRIEDEFLGRLCLLCMLGKFSRLTLQTLFGTWWTIVGLAMGPWILMNNIEEFFSFVYKYLSKKPEKPEQSDDQPFRRKMY